MKITTTVRSDDLSLLAQGIRRALLNRGNKLAMGVGENDCLVLMDRDTGECVELI